MTATYLEALFGLHGKTALVSGASRGIGRAIADGLAQAGASVIGLGRSTVVEGDAPAFFHYESCDVTIDQRFREICTRIVASQGKLDVYVHAAGVSLANGERDRLENFDRTIEVNLRAAYHCAVIVAEAMARGGGSIINVTSIGSVLGFPDNPGYVASKGGLRLLTRALALDLAGSNIRVNNVAPGYVHTAMTDKSFSDPALHQERLCRTMLKRWGKPGDVVGAAIFLASAASSYITGQDVIVDGGWTAKGL